MNQPRPADSPHFAWVASLGSGFLLFTAFHPLQWTEMAYVALIPWIWALSRRGAPACRLSFLAGLAFWCPSLFFLTPVTVPGAFTLAVYCALYFIPVGWVWARAFTGLTAATPWRRVAVCFGGAAWWCVWEWVRGWFLTGFPWNPMAVSQVDNLALIQLAGWTGIQGISFVLVAMNLGIALGVLRIFERKLHGRIRTPHPEVYLPIILLMICFTWGVRQLRELQAQVKDAETARVAIVQPNLGMYDKWSFTSEAIMQNYRDLWRLSDAALRSNPDLLLWPETAVAHEILYDEVGMGLVESLTTNGVPLIVGSLDYATGEPPHLTRNYNASFLFRNGGVLDGRYYKRHLVMFGEYVPIPFLRGITPIQVDVDPGEEPGLFDWVEKDRVLGIMICFEDLMPYIAANLREAGAEVFVVQTNDAWFDPYWGSRAHMAHAVFRSVEQGIPMVRCGNSGVSCVIAPSGAVLDVFEDPRNGKVQIPGTKPMDLPLVVRKKRPIGPTSPLWPIVWCSLSLLCRTGWRANS